MSKQDFMTNDNVKFLNDNKQLPWDVLYGKCLDRGILLEKIERTSDKFDNVLAKQYPQLFEYKYSKYVKSLDIFKGKCGKVHVFNLGHGLELQNQLVQYQLQGVMQGDGITQENNKSLYKILQPTSRDFIHEVRQVENGKVVNGNGVALYLTDDVYLTCDNILTDDEVRNILDGKLHVEDVVLDIDLQEGYGTMSDMKYEEKIFMNPIDIKSVHYDGVQKDFIPLFEKAYGEAELNLDKNSMINTLQILEEYYKVENFKVAKQQ